MYLSRLDQIAKTIRTLEPIGPKAKERPTGLRALVDDRGLNGRVE